MGVVKRGLSLGLALALASPAQAGAPPALSKTDRAAATNRPVAVSLAPGIGTSVDVGRVVSDTAYGGGLLGAIILSSTDDKRKTLTVKAGDRAQSAIAPLSATLKNWDFSGLALETSRKAMARTDGFDPSAVALVPATGTPTNAALIAAHPSDQLGLLAYRMQMSPDFTHLQLIVDIAIARTRGMVPVYGQRIVSLVELRQRSYLHEENVARWSSDDGRIVRQAIATAFRRLETAIPAVINLDPARFTLVTNKAKTGSAFAAGFYGPLLLRDESGPVIWSKGNGFIALQTAGD